jgi:hypothetical protein
MINMHLSDDELCTEDTEASTPFENQLKPMVGPDPGIRDHAQPQSSPYACVTENSDHRFA